MKSGTTQSRGLNYKGFAEAKPASARGEGNENEETAMSGTKRSVFRTPTTTSDGHLETMTCDRGFRGDFGTLNLAITHLGEFVHSPTESYARSLPGSRLSRRIDLQPFRDVWPLPCQGSALLVVCELMHLATSHTQGNKAGRSWRFTLRAG